MAEKRPKAKELRNLPHVDLQAELEKVRAELWHNRLKVREGALPQGHLLRSAKRQIARIQTVLNEQQQTGTT